MTSGVSAAAPPAVTEPRPPAADVGRGHDVPVTVIDGSAHWSRWWADLYAYRGALQSLAWRNLRSRYKQAVLGMAWAVVQPAVQVGVFTLLFGVLAKVPSGGLPYPVFALSGLLLWNLFAKIVQDGAVSLAVNQNIITKLFFPRIYLVLAVGASALVDAAVTALLLVAMMAYYRIVPGWGALIALPLVAATTLVAYGVAALLAAVNARWRDVQHTLPFLLQIGLFVTPVVYRNTLVPPRLRWLLALNPIAGLLEWFRASLLGLPMPEGRVLVGSLVIGALSVVVGAWYFTRSEPAIVDVI